MTFISLLNIHVVYVVEFRKHTDMYGMCGHEFGVHDIYISGNVSISESQELP